MANEVAGGACSENDGKSECNLLSQTPELCPVSVQEKPANRNKRKLCSDPLVSDCSFALAPKSLHSDLFAAEKGNESLSLASLSSLCNMCHDVVTSPLSDDDDDDDDDEPEVGWGKFMVMPLNEILLTSLDAIFKDAAKIIEAYGYAEEVASCAVLASAAQSDCEDIALEIVDSTLELLKSSEEIDILPNKDFLREWESMEKTVLWQMVKIVTDAQPRYTLGDTMWALLICDMSVSRACDMACNPSQGYNTVADGSVSSNMMVANSVPKVDANLNERLKALAPSSPKTLDANVWRSLKGANQLQENVPTISDPCSTTQYLKPNEVITRSEEEVPLASATQPAKEGKVVASRKILALKKNVLRQKSINFGEGQRASKPRSVSRMAAGASSLDRRCKATRGYVSVNRKSATSKLDKIAPSKAFEGLASQVINSTNCPSSESDLDSVDSTKLSLSLSSSWCRDINLDSYQGARNGVDVDVLSCDTTDKELPKVKKDELTWKLTKKMMELQFHLQQWTDWAQNKVMQAARRLGKDKEEFQILRQEKEGLVRLQEERKSIEESSKKKLAEIEAAIIKASNQVERANSAARRLEAENVQLRVDMETAKAQAAQSAANCQELSEKEAKTLKSFQSLQAQKVLLQDELLAEKNRLAQLQQHLQQAKDYNSQVQARWKQEEILKEEMLALRNIEKKERENIETSAKSQENALLLDAENDLQRFKADIRMLEAQISLLMISSEDTSKNKPLQSLADKVHANSFFHGKSDNSKNTLLNSQVRLSRELDSDEIQRERECVMCLSEEMSVVFLPCAHQVICRKCNDLHLNQGMKDCPSCRTPILRRICVRAV